MPVSKIASNEVELGMYIARLDRPWTETPFLFQGFEVHSQDELEELRRHARHVYIIVPDEEIELKKIPDNSRGSIQQLHKLHHADYQTRVSARDEIKAIRRAHAGMVELVTEIDSLVRAGSRLQIADIEEPVSIMVDSVMKNPDAYLWLNRIRRFDSFVYRDALSASVWATALGRQIGINGQDLKTLATGCLLMDIGKLALPVELLHKQGRLNDEEWEKLKRHVEHGVEILEADPNCSRQVRDILLTHHERLDGSGYPVGLRGSHIPLFGQIAGIVDFYVAVTTPRPYARSVSPSQAEQMLYEQKGRFFDETLVDFFIQTLSTYPTGSLVELSSGEVAIVMAQNPALRLKPDVVLLLDPDKQPYRSYTVASLANYQRDDMPVLILRTLSDGEFGVRVEELSL